MQRPLLIDTDAGVDDALAIILALRSPELHVHAITTVAGNVEVEKCTANVNLLLELLKPSARPIVAQGSSRPLRRKLFTAPEVHGKDGLGNIRGQRQFGSARKGAVHTIVEACERFGSKLAIVALGPMTNIARAYLQRPALVRRIAHLISMGGALRVPGNSGPVAEFNYFVDPEAAQLLVHSRLPLTVVPLDVTEQLVLMRNEVEYRARRRASRVAKSIMRFTDFYMKYHRKTEGFYGGYLHDPLAMAIAIDRSLVTTRKLVVDVETRGVFTRGMTVAGEIQPCGRRNSVVNVAVKVDRERFFRLFHERLWL